MHKLLIVEDDPSYSFQLEQLLKDQFEITKSVDGMSALGQINSGEFDCVILDIDILGEVDGLDVLKAIKNSKGTKRTPVVVLTNVGPQRKNEFLSAGADEYMFKGEVDLDDIQKVVVRLAEDIPAVEPGDN